MQICLGAIIAAAAVCYRLQSQSTGLPTALFPSETGTNTILDSTHPGLQSTDPQPDVAEPPVIVSAIMPALTARGVTNTGAASLYNTEVHLVKVSSGGAKFPMRFIGRGGTAVVCITH